MAETKLSNLVDPQVVADFVETKLIDAIRFAPLATVKNDLVGKAGDEVTLPKWQYIGDAGIVQESESIPVANLSQTTDTVKIHKLGKGVGFTDEAKLSGLGGAELTAQAVDQIVKSIASSVESELIADMQNNTTLTYSYDGSKDAAVNIASALELFGEDMDGQKVMLVPPSLYTTLVSAKGWIPNTELGANILVNGTVGQIMGCDIVVTNRLKNTTTKDVYALTKDKAIDASKTYYTLSNGVYSAVGSPKLADIKTYYEKTVVPGNEAFIVKPGALAIFSKRETMVEFDRDPSKQIDYVYGSKLYAPYVYDASKLIKINLA